MNGVARISRLAGGLLWVALVVSGCGLGGQSRYESWQFERAVEEMTRSSRRNTQQSSPPVTRQAKPPTQQPKTTESTKDDDERHPSRWKRKLKAAYA